MSEPWLYAGVALVAFAYSLVGHGGASGYLALLAFTSIAAETRSSTALTLNILVSGITFILFRRHNYFSWALAWPFLLGSVPFAFLGGSLRLDGQIQNWILAATFLFASISLFGGIKPFPAEPKQPMIMASVAAGAGIGLLSGIVGVGGGIFLSPLLILLNWARPHTVAAVAAAFIFANSIAGLAARPAAHLTTVVEFLPLLGVGALAAVAGSYFGANHTTSTSQRRFLAAVLLVAVWKFGSKAAGL